MTLKIGICTKQDLDEAMKLQKREQYEDERKRRIFNAKQRLYGVSMHLQTGWALLPNIPIHSST